jgi:hypothetical protein
MRAIAYHFEAIAKHISANFQEINSVSKSHKNPETANVEPHNNQRSQKTW